MSKSLVLHIEKKSCAKLQTLMPQQFQMQKGFDPPIYRGVASRWKEEKI